MAYKVKIEEKLDWGKFVSPISDKNTYPYSWYSFKHRYGSELVANIFTKFGLTKADTILDPYCGGGTTLIKAKLDGYNSVGLDISPFSVFLSKTLTTHYDQKKLQKELKNISHKIDKNVEIPDVAILKKAFTDSTLKYIYSLKNSINLINAPERYFLLLSLFTIINDISKAKKSGGFLRISNSKKVSMEAVKDKYIRTTEKLINESLHIKYSNCFSKVMLGDAREYPQELKKYEYDAILTSPPYPNRHDYTRIYELELLLGFICNNQSLKQLRYDTLRSHVEARKKYEANGYIAPIILQKQIEKLNHQKLNNSKIIPTISGYFEDMYLCLKQMSNVIKKDKYVGLVVSNVRFAGIIIPVDEILSEIGEQVGLYPQYIYVLRYRGNSSQQMAKYNREPSRESLVVWEKC